MHNINVKALEKLIKISSIRISMDFIQQLRKRFSYKRLLSMNKISILDKDF